MGTVPQELSSFQLTGEPVMVQKKNKPSGAQRKRLREQKEATAAQQAGGEPGVEAPTAANCATVLMPSLRAAVTQKDRCHLVGHLRVPRFR